jgi:SAM-dependent methyltransferase
MGHKLIPENMFHKGASAKRSPKHGSSVEVDVRGFYDREGWELDESDTFADTRRWGASLPAHQAHGRRILGDIKVLFEGGGRFFLNCGCGPFTDAAMAVSDGYRRRICLDISGRALEICRGKLGGQGIYLCGSMIHLPLPDSLADGTFCEHVLYHVEKSEQENAVRELIRVTKPGAPIVIIYSHPFSPLNTVENVLRFLGVTKLLGGRKLYFFRWRLQWWQRFADHCDVEIRPYDPISARQASVLLRNERIAQGFFRICRWLEARWPGLAVRLWNYPMIVLTKRHEDARLSKRGIS